MLLRHVGTFALLGAWTLAPPVSIQQSDQGKLEISVGGAVGEHVDVTRSCSGDVLSTNKVPARQGGAALDFEHGALRVSAFAGGVSLDGPYSDGAYAGGLVAYEGGGVGIGGGIATVPSFSDASILPSVYLRFGRRDKVNFVTDFLAPSPILGSTGIFRAGIGFPIGGRHRAMLGLGGGRLVEGADRGGPFTEVDIALSDRWGVFLAGSAFPGEGPLDWAVGGGVSLRPR